MFTFESFHIFVRSPYISILLRKDRRRACMFVRPERIKIFLMAFFSVEIRVCFSFVLSLLSTIIDVDIRNNIFSSKKKVFSYHTVKAVKSMYIFIFVHTYKL